MRLLPCCTAVYHPSCAWTTQMPAACPSILLFLILLAALGPDLLHTLSHLKCAALQPVTLLHGQYFLSQDSREVFIYIALHSTHVTLSTTLAAPIQRPGLCVLLQLLLCTGTMHHSGQAVAPAAS